MPTDEQIEIILKVGAAGGSLTIFGVKSLEGQWKFFQERNETAAYNFLSVEDREGVTPFSRTRDVYSIEEALLSLGRYPWFKLFPMEVHPDFRDLILKEVKRLGGRLRAEHWKERFKRSGVLQQST